MPEDTPRQAMGGGNRRERSEDADEYRSVVAVIQDTGHNIWVINGSFLVVLGLLAKPLLERNTLSLASSLALCGMGIVLALLSFAAFERNYAFYNYRIRYARALEHQLGHRLFTLGERLSQTGEVDIPGSTQGMQEPITMWRIGRLFSIQELTRILIALVGLLFYISVIVRLCQEYEDGKVINSLGVVISLFGVVVLY